LALFVAPSIVSFLLIGWAETRLSTSTPSTSTRDPANIRMSRTTASTAAILVGFLLPTTTTIAVASKDINETTQEKKRKREWNPNIVIITIKVIALLCVVLC